MGLTSPRPYKFYWRDPHESNEVDSDFWAKNLPDNGDKLCVGFDVSDSYSLNNFNCYSLYGYFCESPLDRGLKCPLGYGKYKDTCFLLVTDESSLKSWYAAKNYCESKSMSLMTIKDKEKFNSIQNYLKLKSTSSKDRAWVCY